MKKILSFLLTLSLLFCLLPVSVSAASTQATQSADTLYTLGLFKGTGTNKDGSPIYNLDAVPTRNQAIIMLVRLLGKEQEALSGTWELPFTDVAKDSTAYPYIGYAYANGLTGGTSATTYSGTNPIRFNQYITFVLRALGYTSGEDFEVGTSWEFSDKIGLTSGTYSAATKSFTRGDVAAISCSALSVCKKDSSTTLLEQLLDEGAVSMGAALMAGIAPNTEIVTFDVTPNEEGEYRFYRDELNREFSNVSNFHVTEVNENIKNVDEYLIQSEQMASLIPSHGREGTGRQRQHYSGKNPHILLLYSGPTTLRGFSIGNPERLADGTDRYTMVLCDYSFEELYKQQSAAFDSVSYPYIEPSAVQTCGAVYFRNGYQMEVPFDDYWLRHQLYFLWMLMTADDPVWTAIQPISNFQKDIDWWMSEPHRISCCYLLLDANKNPIGYTIIQREGY